MTCPVTTRPGSPATWNSATPPAPPVHGLQSAEGLIRSSDLVVFATVAAEPHVHEVSWFAHNPVVLHVSLRDLAPEILLVDQCG